MAGFNYMTMTFEDIKKWCVDNGKGEWLKHVVKEKVEYTDKEGNKKSRKKSFIEVKNAFCHEYMPDIMPAKKSKKPTMEELVKDL